MFLSDQDVVVLQAGHCWVLILVVISVSEAWRQFSANRVKCAGPIYQVGGRLDHFQLEFDATKHQAESNSALAAVIRGVWGAMAQSHIQNIFDEEACAWFAVLLV